MNIWPPELRGIIRHPEARGVPGLHGKNDKDFVIKSMILRKEHDFNYDEVYSWLKTHTWERRFEKIRSIINEFMDIPNLKAVNEAENVNKNENGNDNKDKEKQMTNFRYILYKRKNIST